MQARLLTGKDSNFLKMLSFADFYETVQTQYCIIIPVYFLVWAENGEFRKLLRAIIAALFHNLILITMLFNLTGIFVCALN
jgi:hypothetical protein